VKTKPRLTQQELAEKMLIDIGRSAWYDLTLYDFYNRPKHGWRGRLENPTLSWYESLNTWTSMFKRDRPSADMNNLKALERHVSICEKYADIPPFIAENPDGHSLIWAIRQVSRMLTEREAHVIFLKFGLRDGHELPFSELGANLNVTRERARQILLKAIRKLRHPTRFRHLQPFLYPYNRNDERASMARYELHLRLSEVYPVEFSFNLVMRLRRRYLADAFKAVNGSSFRELNKLMAYSCSFQMSACQLCGEPALPMSDWCLTHLDLKKQIVVICDGCGIKFPRRASQLVGFSKQKGRTQYAVFHDKKCFLANQVRLELHGGDTRWNNGN
tara:strand:+ start:1324 stop:2316 length:993 start_codon:yes stop_codon:yes gene_type:complete